MPICVPKFSTISNQGGNQSESNLIAPAIRGLKKARIRAEKLEQYKYDPFKYIKDKLGWEPWCGENGHPGQAEILEQYVLALRQQHERQDFENGVITEGDLKYYIPGEPIKNRLHIEAGHTVGKTKLDSGLVNHFFDCFTPSIIYSFAPSWKQVHDLLWKEIKTDRRDKGLPGRILDLRLEVADNHFATGMATNDAGGTGTERAQGQHGKYLMFIMDEAEGIPDFIFDAVDAMASGGIVIVIYTANPRTRASRFYKLKTTSSVASYRLSCLHHPNVTSGREIVPNAVKRSYVEEMIEKHCEEVQEHNDDDYTFEVEWKQGIIFAPDAEFMFRVLGIAPKNLADDTLITPGRYEAACKREPLDDSTTSARMGVDVARFGSDYGTLYTRHKGTIKKTAKFAQLDYLAYAGRIKDEAKVLARQGVKSLHVRVDGGGGFGGGVVDLIKKDPDIVKLFEDYRVFEVHFNGVANDKKAYADLVTEMYAQTAETLRGVRIEKPPTELEDDLTDRKYEWVNKSGISVKKLEAKDKFKKRHSRSPDDGDGLILCASPDFLFGKTSKGTLGASLSLKRISPNRI